MAMTRRVDVRPRLVYRRVYEEARRVGRSALIPSHHLAVVVDEHHVRGLEEPEVFTQWVGPKRVRVFWVAHGDVAAHAFCQAIAREYTEGPYQLLDLSCAMAMYC
jgi:hypothetical protein